MKISQKKAACCAFIAVLLSVSPLFSAADASNAVADADGKPWWYKLELGKRQFRQGDYGVALTLFEDARNSRKNGYETMRGQVLVLLSHPEVRGLHDNLDSVLKFAHERYYQAAEAAFEELFYMAAREALGNSAEASLDLFDRLAGYPEAEYWIAEVYRVEGSPIAYAQYEKALSLLKNTPEETGSEEFEIEILYKLAALDKLQGRYTAMEERLLDVLKKDSLWSSDGADFLRRAMNRTMENNGLDSFIRLYRHKNVSVEKAHRLLADYYYKSGRHKRAEEHYLFAWMIQSTVILDSLSQNVLEPRDFDTLQTSLSGLVRRKDVLAYMDEAEYFKTTYYLGASLFAGGNASAAASVWTFLSNNSGAGLWQRRAVTQLSSPTIDAATP